MESSSESDKSSSSSDESFDTEEESFDDDDEVGKEASNNNDSEKEIVNNVVVDVEKEENETEVESIEVQKELVWKDTKLFPPERSKSDVWKFGGFPKDENGKLLKERVICSICGKKIHYANSPTNFRIFILRKLQITENLLMTLLTVMVSRKKSSASLRTMNLPCSAHFPKLKETAASLT